MKTNLTLLFYFCLCLVASAQNKAPENRIVVIGQASVNAPANRLDFIVTLNTIDTINIENVYRQHKLTENKMVALLKELGVPEVNVSYTLFSLDRIQEYDTKDWYFRGSQRVRFSVDSVQLYNKVQAKLIEGGFMEFESNFNTTDISSYRDQALEAAIAAAKEKAAIMAKAADRKIKRIVKVSDTDESDPMLSDYSYRYSAAASVAPPSPMDDTLVGLSQTIPVSAAVKVVFELR